jgi:hypothetical protein
VDDDERQALRAEGRDLDDPMVTAAIDLVRWELWLCARVLCDYDGGCGPRGANGQRARHPQRALVRQLAPAWQRS